MNVCLVSYYHLDVTVSDFKYLQDYCNVDLYFIYNDGQKSADAVDMSRFETRNGFIDPEIVNLALNDLGGYVENKGNLFFYEVSRKGFSHFDNYLLFYKLGLQIKKKRYDAIHIIGQSPFLAILHLVLHRYPRVHTLHESTAHWGETKSATLWFLRFLCRSKSELVFNSKKTMQRYINYTRCNIDKCHLIYFGYFEHYRSFLRDENPSDNSLLFFGNVREHKGLRFLIEAIYIVAKQIPDVNLVIAGRWGNSDLKTTLLSNKNFTIIDKFLSTKEVVEVISKSQFIVCPYLTASQSGVVNTAFSIYKPVIASDVDGLSEVIEDGESGLLVPPKDINALAEAIIKLLKDSSMISTMSLNIKENEHSEMFSWQSIAYKTYSLYKYITNKNNKDN